MTDRIEIERLRERKGEVLRALAKSPVALSTADRIAAWVWDADKAIIALLDELDRAAPSPAIGRETDSTLEHFVKAADKLRASPELRDSLQAFAHNWGLDAYSPDYVTREAVRETVRAMLILADERAQP